MEEITALTNLLVNNGLAIGITAYFLYRDFRFNAQQVELLSKLNDFIDNYRK